MATRTGRCVYDGFKLHKGRFIGRDPLLPPPSAETLLATHNRPRRLLNIVDEYTHVRRKSHAYLVGHFLQVFENSENKRWSFSRANLSTAAITETKTQNQFG